MKKVKTLEKKIELPDISQFGQYREGLTNVEVEEYLRQAYNIVASKKRKVCPTKIIQQFRAIVDKTPSLTKLTSEGLSLMNREGIIGCIGKLFFNKDIYLC